MSKPRKINDHGSWIGGRSEGSVFPMGVKHKMESSADGAGGLPEYTQTSEDIKSEQEMGIKKIRSHSGKPGYNRPS